jgi:hypothetical protein
MSPTNTHPVVTTRPRKGPRLGALPILLLFAAVTGPVQAQPLEILTPEDYTLTSLPCDGYSIVKRWDDEKRTPGTIYRLPADDTYANLISSMDDEDEEPSRSVRWLSDGDRTAIHPNAKGAITFRGGDRTGWRWRPTGITGSGNDDPAYKAVRLVGWSSHDDQGARVSFIHSGRYLHALLVDPYFPNGDGLEDDFQDLSQSVLADGSQIGGIAWYAGRLYVTAGNQLLVFSIRDFLRVDHGLFSGGKIGFDGDDKAYAYGCPLAIPLVARYRIGGPDVKLTFASIDKSLGSAALILGGSTSGGVSKLFRWGLSGGSPSEHPEEAYLLPFTNVTGGVMQKGRGDRMWVVGNGMLRRRDDPLHGTWRTEPWASSSTPRDLYLQPDSSSDGDTTTLWGVSRESKERYVFSVRTEDLIEDEEDDGEEQTAPDQPEEREPVIVDPKRELPVRPPRDQLTPIRLRDALPR